VKIPERYEAQKRLGKGGGGEVYSVRDRVTGAELALKAIAEDAGATEDRALVREAIALRALSGLGLPRILAFGTLSGGGRYMVRELVVGEPLDEVYQSGQDTPWLEPFAEAADQLTLVHRSGLFHGDVKPANIVVGPNGRATLVDLGLSAPFREGGRAHGLTPKYAAPELLEGEPVGVRAEVYALGATLQEGLDERGHELDKETYTDLSKVAKRATEGEPEDRYPSVDELASAVRRAAKLGKGSLAGELGWKIAGLDSLGPVFEKRVLSMESGDALALEGASGSGRSTLLARLSFSLGLLRVKAAVFERPSTGLTDREALSLVVGKSPVEGLVLCIDDWETLPDDTKKAIAELSAQGARLVVVSSREALAPHVRGTCTRFDMPRLEARAAEELARRAIVSLPDSLVTHLVERADGNPGALRAMLAKLGREALVSATDVEQALAKTDGPVDSAARQGVALDDAESAAERGRFDLASEALRGFSAGNEDDRIRAALVRARVFVAKGDATEAARALDAVSGAAQGPHARAWSLLRARTANRAGEFDRALELTESITKGRLEDAIASEALSVRGVALAYKGEDARARQALESAVMVANLTEDARALGIAKGSLGLAHQRAGRAGDARRSYEEALLAAEKAADAWGVATTRLNLSVLAQTEGDLGRAIVHLEAATDLGERAGGAFAARQAALNLANLDLYLGRIARARTGIDALVAVEEELVPAARAQLLGLHADLAQRTGETSRAAEKYEACAKAYDALGRTLDAAEARLEGLIAKSKEPDADGTRLLAEIEAIRPSQDAGFGEHEALASLAKAQNLALLGDEVGAKSALDAAYERAKLDGKRELAWRALEARGALAASQGNMASARRDTEAALAMLEEVAAKLPRDLREVFWDDPRRRTLRSEVATTLSSHASPTKGRDVQTLSSHGRTTRSSVSAHGPVESDRLSRIFEITRDLAREKDLGRLLELVTDHAIALVGAERGFVLLAGEDGELVAQTVRGPRADDGHAKFSRSVAEKVLADGEPVIAASARDDERLAEAVSVHQLMIQSIACVPIRGARRASSTIGALYLETRLRPGLRFREELPTLSAFADQAAIAIESARLIEENIRRADELAIANEELQRAHARLEEALGRRTEQLAATRRDLKQVRAELRSHFGYAGLVGTSAPMRKLYAILERVKDTDVPVLVTGESGTGKEVVARAIHQASPRAKNAFIGVNCGAIPGNLLESELFGHVRGAFTGADRERKGLFREAEGGTILLDEIGEMPHKMQAGLLRVLQEKTVRPVGGVAEEPVDVRVVAATNRELSQMVRENTFREDLYYRLHVITVEIPPLRARLDDLPALVDHFLGIFAARHRRERKSVSRPAMKKLSSYDWPGNVRQLEHVLLNAWLMSDESDIGPDDFVLPQSSPEAKTTSNTPRARTQGEFRSSEKERILEALGRANWNRMQAAKLVGIPRRTFYRRLREYGILGTDETESENETDAEGTSENRTGGDEHEV
jgi:serine/threonine-protein kinase PknK